MFWRKMGCQPIVVPWQEVKAALAAKEIDVLPTHKAHLMPLGFCRYARYVTLLGGIPAAVGLAMNENKYQTLPPDVQNIVAETFMQASGHFTETVLTMETKNEVENIERNDAVYLKVNLLSWQTLAIKIRQELIAEGLLSQVVWDMISQLAPASHPLETS
jgi:TRAP-type C4-dicarboxylate transport system substrate-binding protein